MTHRNRFPRMPRAAVMLALVGLAAAGLRAQTVPTLNAINTDWPETVKVDGIEILPVLKNVYMLAGGGANVAIQIGDEGVVMVDTGAAGQTAKLQAAVRRLTRKPLRYLINSGP